MKQKILTVDDDENIRKAVEAAFTGSYEVLSADGGRAALEIIRLEKPDFVFLDVKMPGLSGLEVLALVKDTGASPVVWMLTGEEDLAVAVKALEAGARGYLTKPFELERIRGVVSGALEGVDKKAHPEHFSDRPWLVKRTGE